MTIESLGYTTLMGEPPKVYPNHVTAGMKIESLGYTTLMIEPPKV